MTAIITGSFTATGQSAWANVRPGPFRIALQGTFTATARLELSFDGGTTAIAVARDATGSNASYTAPMALTSTEYETGVLYRWNCTAFTSGTVNYRISQ